MTHVVPRVDVREFDFYELKKPGVIPAFFVSRVVIHRSKNSELTLNATIFKINCGKRFWVMNDGYNSVADFISSVY